MSDIGARAGSLARLRRVEMGDSLPADPADIVTLRVNGTDYAGWTGIPTIQMGMERGAGAFEIELSERWPGGQHRPIRKEDSCALSIGTEVVITGQVDEVERQLGKDSHTISVSGRDATGELIDWRLIAAVEMKIGKEGTPDHGCRQAPDLARKEAVTPPSLGATGGRTRVRTSSLRQLIRNVLMIRSVARRS